MRMHELKVWPIYFEAFQKGIKTFEIRKNDRDFKVGDILVLREFDPRLQVYLKGISQAQITYILRAPISV